MADNEAWEEIFKYKKLLDYDFKEPVYITAEDIKNATKKFKATKKREPRILCKQDTREDRPEIFKKKGLFILPVRNGRYVILKGEGYVDIPEIKSQLEIYNSKLDFNLKSSKIGNSEMQHVDFAYASSLIRHFVEDPSLVLTIRGRKYTPQFEFYIGKNKISVEKVQTEVDAGYEGKDKIVLVEAKNKKAKNTIVRQLYYPYRQWKINTGKDIVLLFFEKIREEYHIWQYEFEDEERYDSIKLKKSRRYVIK